MPRIIVDSGCDLTEEMRSGLIPVERIPLSLHVGGRYYIDDQNLDVSEYIEHMESYSGEAKTAAPSPELFLEAYKKEGSVFVVTLSSKLSGSYNSAVLARQMYLDEIGEKFIHVIDSCSACVGLTMVALRLNECIKNNLPDGEIVASVNKFLSERHTFFILEKFDNLVKNGRINPYIAKIASLLSIKIIGVEKDGELAMIDKARGYKKAIARLIELIQKENIDFENLVLGITHVKCLERALDLKEEILKKIRFRDVIICEAGGLASTYAQKGGLVLSY